jgi:hypothetical protein
MMMRLLGGAILRQALKPFLGLGIVLKRVRPRPFVSSEKKDWTDRFCHGMNDSAAPFPFCGGSWNS